MPAQYRIFLKKGVVKLHITEVQLEYIYANGIEFITSSEGPESTDIDINLGTDASRY